MAGEALARVRRSWLQTEVVSRILSVGLENPAIVDLIDADVELVLPASLPSGGRHRGIAALRAGATGVMAPWRFEDGPRSEITELGDDAVLVSTTGAATCRTTGRSMDVDLRTVVDFAGPGGPGRVVRVSSYWRDTAAALKALGIWESWA